MLVSDVLADVRDILQDHEGDRYPEPSLIRLVNMAMLELRRVRPDYFIGAYAAPVPRVSLPGSELQVAETCYPSIVKYVAGMAELRDDEFATDGRAAALMGAFKTDLGVT